LEIEGENKMDISFMFHTTFVKLIKIFIG